MRKKVEYLIMGILAISVLSGCSVRNKGAFSKERVFKGEGVNKTLEIDNLEEINLNVGYGGIYITSYEGEGLEVSIDVDGEDTSIYSDGNKAFIKDNKRELDFDVFEEPAYKRNIYVKVPNGFNGNLTIECGNSEVKVNKINLKEMDLDIGSGKVEIEDSKINNLDLDQGNGKAYINLKDKYIGIDIEGGVLDLNLILKDVSGDINIDGGVIKGFVDVPKDSKLDVEYTVGVGKGDILENLSEKKEYKLSGNIGVGTLKIK